MMKSASNALCTCVCVCTVLGSQGSLSSPDISLSSEGVLWAERVQEEPDRVLTEVLAPLPRPRFAGLPTPRPPATRTASSSAQ